MHHLGIRDYVEKSGFDRHYLGLSGGVDSALVATLAVDALGAERVDAVMMPSPYTSQISLDAKTLLEIWYRRHHLDIDPAMHLDTLLGDVFAEASPDLARENLQSRLRAADDILTRQGRWFTTGNKSEYAPAMPRFMAICAVVTFAFESGNTCFELCHWRNENLPKGVLGLKKAMILPVIPERISPVRLLPNTPQPAGYR